MIHYQNCTYINIVLYFIRIMQFYVAIIIIFKYWSLKNVYLFILNPCCIITSIYYNLQHLPLYLATARA